MEILLPDLGESMSEEEMLKRATEESLKKDKELKEKNKRMISEEEEMTRIALELSLREANLLSRLSAEE